MKFKDLSNEATDDVHHYWLQTVLEDRAETAGAPPMLPKPAEDEEDSR